MFQLSITSKDCRKNTLGVQSEIKCYSYHMITLAAIVIRNNTRVSLVFSADSLILANDETSAKFNPCLMTNRTYWPINGVQRILINLSQTGTVWITKDSCWTPVSEFSMSELIINVSLGWNLSFLSTVQMSNMLTLRTWRLFTCVV